MRNFNKNAPRLTQRYHISVVNQLFRYSFQLVFTALFTYILDVELATD
jgi:hypothetical protein